jgi:cytochrome P450 family 6
MNGTICSESSVENWFWREQVRIKMSSVVILIIAIAFLGYLWVKKRFNYWKDRGFLQTDATFPFGSLQGAGTKRTAFETMDIHYKNFKGKAPAIGFYTFLAPSIMLIDPELIKNVFVKDFNVFHTRGMYYNKEDDPMSAR